MSPMKELLTYIAQNLVDNPDEVTVTERTTDEETVFEVRVAEGDMHLYDKFFGEYGKVVAQILLTGDDVDSQEKKCNLVNTFSSLLDLGIIPIVNENDSVSYAEIEEQKEEHQVFGDNDTLSAVVAILCGADKLVLLSDIDGLYDGNPNERPDARLIREVRVIDDEIRALAGGAGSSRGTGGMGYGDNTKAMLMTRGLTEIARVGEKMGGRKETFAGLAGMGDLIVTCTSRHSRNRRAGLMIGEGIPPQEALKQVGAVVEGYYAAASGLTMAKKCGVEMPITEAIYNVLYNGSSIRDAVGSLMTRAKRHETEESWS